MKPETITGEQVGLDLIKSLQQYKAGKTRVVYSPATGARKIRHDAEPSIPMAALSSMDCNFAKN